MLTASHLNWLFLGHIPSLETSLDESVSVLFLELISLELCELGEDESETVGAQLARLVDVASSTGQNSLVDAEE